METKQDTEIVKEAKDSFMTMPMSTGMYKYRDMNPFTIGYVEGYKAALKEIEEKSAPTIHRQTETQSH